MTKRVLWVVVALLAFAASVRATAPEPETDNDLPPLPPQFARPEAQPRARAPSAARTELPPRARGRGTARGAWLACGLSAATAGVWLTRWRHRRLFRGGVALIAVVLLGVSGCPAHDEPRRETSEKEVGWMDWS